MALIVLRPEPDEPTFDGRKLSEWLEIYGRSSREAPNTNALNAMIKIGTNGLPFLLHWISYEPRPPNKVKRLVSKMPMWLTPDMFHNWAIRDEEEFRANTASLIISFLGDNAHAAIPGLVELMNDSGRTNASARSIIALARIGSEALPLLLANLADTNAPNRQLIAGQIGLQRSLVTNAGPAVPFLIECLKDHEIRVRDIAAWSLWRIARDGERPPADQVVPALTGCLDASAPRLLRMRTMLALEVYGDQARPAVPHLLKALADPDRGVRESATNALEQIAPDLLPSN